MTSRDVEGSRTIVAVIVRLPYELSMVPADKIIARGLWIFAKPRREQTHPLKGSCAPQGPVNGIIEENVSSK